MTVPVPAWLDVTPGRIESLSRCWGRDLVDRFLTGLDVTADEVLTTGFVPDRALSGGIAGLAVAGELDGRPAVAKLSPHSVDLGRQVRAARHWGGDVTAEIFASGELWAVMAHAGVPVPSPGDAEQWAAQLDVIAHLIERGPAPGFASTASFVDMLIGLAGSRPASSQLLGVTGLTELVEAANDALRLAGPPVVVHGDLHDGNWLRNGQSLAVIDPAPHLGSAGEDVARWILGGGTDVVAARTGAAAQHPVTGSMSLAEVAAWLMFLGRERAGALVHHGKPVVWGLRFIAAVDRAARSLIA